MASTFGSVRRFCGGGASDSLEDESESESDPELLEPESLEEDSLDDESESLEDDESESLEELLLSESLLEEVSESAACPTFERSEEALRLA